MSFMVSSQINRKNNGNNKEYRNKIIKIFLFILYLPKGLLFIN